MGRRAVRLDTETRWIPQQSREWWRWGWIKQILRAKRTRQELNIECIFGHAGVKEISGGWLEAWAVVTSFTLGQVCAGEDRGPGARHSWGRHGGDSGGLERSDCWLLAEKLSYYSQQIYSKLWLKWWSICSELWLLVSDLLCPSSCPQQSLHSCILCFLSWG